MNDWFELHDAHRSLRATGGSSVSDIRRVLRSLAERKHVESSVTNRFTHRKNRETGLREWYIAAPTRTEAEEWSEPLQNLAPNMKEARLTILALTDASNARLGKLTVMLTGENVAHEPFIVAAHLDDRHMGSGACGHALFHCHVGPSFTATPEVRVPLPALRPAATVEWVLSVAVPNWEPTPWQQVVARAAHDG